MLLFRTLLFYFALIAVIRLLGKRQVGQMEPSELVVAMLLADLASIPMQDITMPMYYGLIPIFTVLGLELLLSVLTLRSIKLRKLLCGKPVILIENGKLLQENMRKTRISIDELTGMLRQKDVLELSTVQYAILETDGSFLYSPFPRIAPLPPKRQVFRRESNLFR